MLQFMLRSTIYSMPNYNLYNIKENKIAGLELQMNLVNADTWNRIHNCDRTARNTSYNRVS